MKEKWVDTTEEIENLHLDLKNPRVPEYARSSEEAIFRYLLEDENVMEIAGNIASNGYHHSAISIVCVEDGKKNVLDGNRRLAACKLLLDPSLLRGKYQKRLDKMRSDPNFKKVEEVKISIAPSRDSAEKEIGDIHMHSLMKPWQVIQKLRKYKDLVGRSSSTIEAVSKDYGITQIKMLKELAKLDLYERILPKLRTDTEKEKLIKTGFNKIERVLVPQHGQSFLKYRIDPELGQIDIVDKKVFATNLKKITPDILNNNILGPQCTKSQVEKRFSELDPSYLKETTKDEGVTKKDILKPIEQKAKQDVPIKQLKDPPTFLPTGTQGSYSDSGALEIIEHISRHFKGFCKQLEEMHDKRQTIEPFKVNNEYDVQYLFHALLRLFFGDRDIRPEEATPSYLSGSSRMDFILPENKIVIEIKKTGGGSRLNNKKLKEELVMDIESYQSHPDCKGLVCFVYDPEGIIKNPRGFERDIGKVDRGSFNVNVIINR